MKKAFLGKFLQEVTGAIMPELKGLATEDNSSP